MRVHVRNGVNVAFLLSDGDAGGALMAGEPVFQVDGQDRTLTSFGAPAYGALVVDKAVGSAPSSECWARCEVESSSATAAFTTDGTATERLGTERSCMVIKACTENDQLHARHMHTMHTHATAKNV